jgi:hypothetical protein
MFLLRSEKDLVEAFFPRDQKRLELPKGVKYPLVVRDYLAWSDPASPRVHLVFTEPGARHPIGLVFDRDRSGASQGSMCEWCHSFGSSAEIGLLMLTVSDNRRVGIHLCRDLSCRDKIEQNLSLSPVSAHTRQKRVLSEMSRFVRRLLL